MMTTSTAFLALEDGTVFEGESFGAPGARTGEVVFNTGMTGYQEILTDPSYRGQIVVMTYPHIGNYGVNPEDMESVAPHAAGFVVREASAVTSNFRAREDLADFMARHGIAGISGVDTRALTRRLRTRGVVRGILAAGPADPADLVKRAQAAPRLEEQDLVKQVTCAKVSAWKTGSPSPFFHPVADAKGREPGRRFKVAALDYGMKHNILRCLEDSGCDVTVFPATTDAADVLAAKPDGVFLSNGPGDPAQPDYAHRCVKGLVGKLPVFGICLGHQILALAFGAKTYKLKFGHRGANHPVKDLGTQKVEITTQNHGYAVDAGGLAAAGLEATHVNLNDGTIEGMRHRSLPVFSVQYHPEASAGPHDSMYLFLRFREMMSSKAPLQGTAGGKA